MNKVTGLYKSIVLTVSVISLYLSAFFITLECFLLILSSKITVNVVIKPILLSIILLIISFFIKRYNSGRFTTTKVYSFLSIFLAFSLSVIILSYLDGNFKNSWDLAISNLESNKDIAFIKSLSFVGMGICFLAAIPLILLLEIKENSKHGKKVFTNIIFWVIIIFIFYLIIGYSNNGRTETLLVDNYLLPLVKFIIGSLPLGWAYELFIGSIENPNISEAKRIHTAT